MSDDIPNPAGDALKLALLQQAIMLPLAAGIFDGGGMLLITSFAVAGFWGGVCLVKSRRRGRYTILDLLFFRWGFFVMVTISFFLARFIWRLRDHGV